MSAIFRSDVFYSDRAYRALVKSPVEFVVGTYKTLGLPQFDADACRRCRQMGQVLFYPPNVAGWPGGANWLTSDMMIARQNFLERSVNSQNVTASSWLGIDADERRRRSRRRWSRRSCRATRRRLRSRSWTRYSAARALPRWRAFGPENYGERVSGAAYLAMAAPAFQLS